MAEAKWGSFKWGDLKWGEGVASGDISSALGGSDKPRIAYLFVIEGVADMWVMGFHADLPNDSLLGSGASSWIGTSYGARRVRPGLELPDPIFHEETDFTSGMLRESSIEVTLHDDETDYIAALFKTEWDASELTRLGERLPPSTTTVAATMKAWDQVGVVTTRNRHIGNEYINSAGIRRSLYITPDNPPAGLDHPVVGSTAAAQLPPVYVSENPHNWAGRRCAIYRLVYTEDGWGDWSQQYQGGALLWIGELTGRGKYNGGRSYVLKCSGAASWERKLLGRHMVTDQIVVTPSIVLDNTQGNDQTQIAVFLNRRGYGDAQVHEDYRYSFSANNAFSTSETVTSLASRIQAVLQAAITNANVTVNGVTANAADTTDPGDGEYEDAISAGTSGAYFNPDNGKTAKIWIENNSVGTDGSYEGVARIGVHVRVLASLGWIPDTWDGKTSIGLRQNGEGPSSIVTWDEPVGHGGSKHEPPASGYVLMVLRTSPPPNEIDWENEGWQNMDNDGVPVTHKAYHSQPVALYPEGKFRMTLPQGFYYFEGQKAQPFANGIQVNGTDVNACGWFLVRGRIRRKDGDVVDYAQVAFCSWVVESDYYVRWNSSDQPELYVERWEDPRYFGLPWRKLGANDPLLGGKLQAWVLNGGEITIQRLIVISGHRPGTPEFAWRVGPRLHVSGGSGGSWSWSGNNEVKPSVGLNDPPGNNDYWSSDLEVQDLGLNIEGELVDFASWAAEAGNGVQENSRLNRFRIATTRPINAQDVLHAMMQQRGWATTLKRGTYGPTFGVCSPFNWLTPEDSAASLTESDIAGVAGDPRSWLVDQEIGWEAAIDTFEVVAGYDALEDGTTFELAQPTLDPWMRGRGGNVDLKIRAPGLVNPLRFGGAETWAQWIGAWRGLHCIRRAQWQAETHLVISTKRLAGAKANAMMPGEVVDVTDQRILAPNGAYGVTSLVGRVMGASHYLSGEAMGTILLQGATVASLRYWGPLATVEGYDTTAETMTLSGNMGSHSIAGQVDADGAVEPSWSSVGGTASWRVMQCRDGEAYNASDDVTGDVVSVAGNVLTYTNLSGTFLPDAKKYFVLQSATDHASTDWPVSVYSVITDATGDYSGNQGFELY